MEDEDKGKGMDTDKDNESEMSPKKENAPLAVPPVNPRKRKMEHAQLQENPSTHASVTPDHVLPPFPKEKPLEYSGEVIKNEKRRAWRSFNMGSLSLGIVREPVSIQVMEDLEGKTHYDELIDPSMLVLADKMRETGFNLLNNTKCDILENLCSLKWLFQEIEALEENIQVTSQSPNKVQDNTDRLDEQVDSQNPSCEQDSRKDQEDRHTQVEQKVQRVDTTNQILTNQILDILHTLNENIVNLGDILKKGVAGEEKGEETQKETRDQAGQEDHQDQDDSQKKQKEGEDNLKENEAVETLQDLDKEFCFS